MKHLHRSTTPAAPPVCCRSSAGVAACRLRRVADTADALTVAEALASLEIDLLEPQSKREMTMADAIASFSSFVLYDEAERCRSIIEKYLATSSDGVGLLQGSGDDYDIYRLNIASCEEAEMGSKVGDAASELLDVFYASHEGKRLKTVFTFEKLSKYMLGMCERYRCDRGGHKRYVDVGNLMVILAFGPTPGQIRHIDNTDGNLFVSVYMSENCPSTVVYEVGGPAIESGHDLVEYWGFCDECGWDDEYNSKQIVHPGAVPDLVREMLITMGDVWLGDRKRRQQYTLQFAFWGTINKMLKRFGKLYRQIENIHKVQVDPGTTFLAGGNEVHAGPPTDSPRMFAYAIGIPEDYNSDEGGSEESSRGKDTVQSEGDDENNGEIQYFPALFHLDLCFILFGMMEYEFKDRLGEHCESKLFLLRILAGFIHEYPSENYEQNLIAAGGREEVQKWLERLRIAINDDGRGVDDLLHEAAHSESSIVQVNNERKKVKRRRANKQKERERERERKDSNHVKR